jgi:hypothetical protein
MKAEIEFSEEHYLRGREWHWRKFGSLQYWWYVGGVVAIFVGVSLIASNPPFGIVLIGYGAYCLLRKEILRRYTLKQVKSSPDFGQTVVLEISEPGFSQEVRDSVSRIVWRSVFESVLTPEGALIYLSKASYIWIPYSALTEPVKREDLNDLLRRKTKYTELPNK